MAVATKEKAEMRNVKEAVRSLLPWGDAGIDVTEEKTVDGILKKSELNWNLERCPMKAQRADGKLVDVPSKFAHIRSTDGKLITTSGPVWRSPDNKSIVKFMKEYAASSNTILESVGSLRDGSIIWGLIRLKKHFVIGKDDRVNGYTLLTVPHKVGSAIDLQTISLRLACLNGMGQADQGEIQYRQNHMTDFNFDEAKKRVLIAHRSMENAERNANIIAKLKLSIDDAVRKVLAPVFVPSIVNNKEAMKLIMTPEGMPKRIAQIVDSIEHAPGAVPGTGWGVMNGVTHYSDHVLGHNARTRMFRSWLGDMSSKKLEVEQKLLDLAS